MSETEAYRAYPPGVRFTIEPDDQRPLAEAARSAVACRYGWPYAEGVTFARIDPLNAAARAVTPAPFRW